MLRIFLPNPKIYGDLALLGDRAQGYSQWHHPNNEKGWQKSFFIYSKMVCELTPPSIGPHPIKSNNPGVLENRPTA